MPNATYRAYPLQEFPLKGGVFQARDGAWLEISEIGLGFGKRVQILSKGSRFGKERLKKGSKVISRLRYRVRNVTQNLTGDVEVLCIENSRRESSYIVASHMPLHQGDELSIEFMGMSANPVLH